MKKKKKEKGIIEQLTGAKPILEEWAKGVLQETAPELLQEETPDGKQKNRRKNR